MYLTVFHLLFFMLVALGGIIGARSGFKAFGYPGGTVGCILGAVLGFLVGQAMFRLLQSSVVWNVRRKSNAALRAQLVDDITPSTYVSCLIISVLLERGGPVDSFREYIFRQLRSKYTDQRKVGLCSLEICYPELAAKLKGFNPLQPSEDDLKRLKEIETAPVDA